MTNYIENSEEIITIPLSFETGEQADTKIYFNTTIKIFAIKAIVTKAIAATDNGTIQGANSTGNSAAGLITCIASAALNTEYTVSPTSNTVVLAAGYYKLTTAKTTVGGKVLVTLHYVKIDMSGATT